MSEGCSAVKRLGESCPRNNNCTYPQCLIDEHKEAWKGVEEEKKALQKRVEDALDVINSENSGLSAEQRLWEIEEILKQISNLLDK